MKNTQQHRNEGAAKELGGKIKKGIGKLTGNEQMEAEGRAKEHKGHSAWRRRRRPSSSPP